MSQQTFRTVLDQLRRLVGPAPVEPRDDAGLLLRFARHRDDGAFTQLVERYGPLVRSVCRRMLRDSHACDDAFQATFLILARKASTVRNHQAIGSWLYGVAYRTSVEARRRTERLQRRETQAADMEINDPGRELDPLNSAVRQEAREALDRELVRLPESLRRPVVLCYFEGKTNEEAARQLGCPTSSLSGRLGKARELLRQRLARRGVALSAGGCALFLSESARAVMPTGAARTTARAALLYVTGQSGTLSTETIALTEGVMRTMGINKLRLALALTLFTGLLLVGTGLALSGGEESSKAAGPGAKAAPKPDPEMVLIGDARRDEVLTKGLDFLVQEQAADGHWRIMDDKYNEGATGLALLALMRADNSQLGKANPRVNTIDKGLTYLLTHENEAGFVGPAYMYTHALATMALCEASTRLGDAKFKEPCQKAVDAIVKAQCPAGSWGYLPSDGANARGDTSVTGWQVQALQLARQAGFKVPADVFDKVSKYLDSVMDAQGRYGYLAGSPAGMPSMTASGMLSRLAIGGKLDETKFAQGYTFLRDLTPGKVQGVDRLPHSEYFRYYATLVMNQSAPEARRWNNGLRRLVLTSQAADGSWGGKEAPMGKIYSTTFALLSLEAEEEFRLPEALPMHDLKAEEVDQMWQQLLNGNVLETSQVVRQLAAAPNQAVPFLKKNVQVVPRPNLKLVTRYISELDHENFDVRQKADEELDKLGATVIGPLREALNNRPSLEVRRRLEDLLAKAEAPVVVPEQVRNLQAIRVLERIGTPEAREVLQGLAEGAAGTLQTEEAAAAVVRLERRLKAAPKPEK